MAALLNNSNNKTGSAPPLSADMARGARNKFLPSIFEETNDEKIQDFRKALMISEDDEGEENHQLAMVRSAIYDAESADDNKPSTTRRATTAARFKPLIRSLSESRIEQWRSKRQGSAYVGGSRNSIPSAQRSFGIGQRKITSPGVNRARQVDEAEVIDLTNPEEVKEIAQKFFQDELKMDLLDPPFDKADDFIANLRWKAEREFSDEELWQRRMSGGGYNNQARLMNNATTNQCTTNDKQKNKHSQVHPYNHTNSPFLQISYSKPKVLLKTLDATPFAGKKKLTTSFKPQEDYGFRRTRGRILNPIRRDVKKKNNELTL